MNRSLDSLRFLDESIGKLQAMVNPPFRCSLHKPSINIEAAAQPLKDCSMALLDSFHQQFLLRRTHCHEYHIRFLPGYIFYQLLFSILLLQITVTITHDVDTGILFFSFSTVSSITAEGTEKVPSGVMVV